MSNAILAELARIVERAKASDRCVRQLANIGRKTIFIRASDTGNSAHFAVEGGRIVGPFGGAPAGNADVVVEGKQETILAIWRGEADPDAAYLLRRVKIRGSFHDATLLKNLFELVKGG